jgi:hypothetical protein
MLPVLMGIWFRIFVKMVGQKKPIFLGRSYSAQDAWIWGW